MSSRRNAPLKRFLCSELPSSQKTRVALTPTEGHHATRVMRLGENDEVEALDGKGRSILARLRIRGSEVFLEYVSEWRHESAPLSEQPPTRLVLEIAILKGEAMEWVIEKAVELGVDHLVPFVSAHTVVQVHRKGPEAFQERWQKIADQALKQCGRLQSMSIALPTTFESLIAEPASGPTDRLWLDESTRDEAEPLLSWLQSNTPKNLHLLIGPEGGWSALERELLERQLSPSPEHGTATESNPAPSRLERVSLGAAVLRAETAALAATALARAALDLRSQPSLTKDATLGNHR
jgi:16S rRNA (uracil1498-N3)-methyltransferase